MSGRTGWGWALIAVGLGCNGPSRSATGEAPAPAPAPSAASPSVEEEKTTPLSGSAPPVADALVPAAVATFHRKAFQPSTSEAKLGAPLGVVTLHDAGFERGFFHVLALFERGQVATWRQTPGKPKDQIFLAHLTPSELATAKEYLTSWTASPGLSAEHVEGNVMGVSARRDDAVVTRYFDDSALPADVSRWVGLLKMRLEATNGGG
jgi:hypothetical protein